MNIQIVSLGKFPSRIIKVCIKPIIFMDIGASPCSVCHYSIRGGCLDAVVAPLFSQEMAMTLVLEGTLISEVSSHSLMAESVN